MKLLITFLLFGISLTTLAQQDRYQQLMITMEDNSLRALQMEKMEREAKANRPIVVLSPVLPPIKKLAGKTYSKPVKKNEFTSTEPTNKDGNPFTDSPEPLRLTPRSESENKETTKEFIKYESWMKKFVNGARGYNPYISEAENEKEYRSAGYTISYKYKDSTIFTATLSLLIGILLFYFLYKTSERKKILANETLDKVLLNTNSLKFQANDKVKHIDGIQIMRVVHYINKREKINFNMLTQKSEYREFPTANVLCSWLAENNERKEAVFPESELEPIG